MPWIFISVIALLVLGLIVFPIINKAQFKRMPAEQQVRIIMQQAKGNHWFKNVSYGSEGKLIYVKNKRKIYYFPWELREGDMYCTRNKLFENWDYPEDAPPFTPEEKEQLLEALEKFNKKSIVKINIKTED